MIILKQNIWLIKIVTLLIIYHYSEKKSKLLKPQRKVLKRKNSFRREKFKASAEIKIFIIGVLNCSY